MAVVMHVATQYVFAVHVQYQLQQATIASQQDHDRMQLPRPLSGVKARRG